MKIIYFRIITSDRNYLHQAKTDFRTFQKIHKDILQKHLYGLCREKRDLRHFLKSLIGVPQNGLYLSRKCLYFYEILHRPVKDLTYCQTSI